MNTFFGHTRFGGANDQGSQLALLRGVTAALIEEADGDAATFRRLQRLADATLNAIRASLDAAAVEIGAAFLGSYYATSIAARVLTPSPQLGRSWNAAFDRAREAIEASSLGSDALKPVDNWLALAVVLRESEPRFLRIISFPGAVTPLLDELE